MLNVIVPHTQGLLRNLFNVPVFRLERRGTKTERKKEDERRRMLELQVRIVSNGPHVWRDVEVQLPIPSLHAVTPTLQSTGQFSQLPIQVHSCIVVCS